MDPLRCLVVPVALLVALCLPQPAAAWESFVSRIYAETNPLLDPQIDPDGNVVVTATFRDVAARDFLITSLAAADGAIRWRRESGGDGSSNVLFGMAVDRRGDVVAVGYTGGHDDGCPECRARRAVFKLDGTTGATIWQPDLGEGGAFAVAIDAADDVFVARDSDSGRLLKLSATDGTVRWQADVLPGYRWSLAADGEGNVTVGSDYVLTKVAGADGHTLWQHDVLGLIERVAVMPNDDLITLEQTHIVRRSGTTGEEFWRAPRSATFALGPGGEMFSSGDYFANDQPWPVRSRGVFVARLDSASGEEEWRHDLTSEDGDGWPASLAVDGDGNAVVQWWDDDGRALLSKVSGAGAGEVWRGHLTPYGGTSRLQVTETGTLVLARGGDGDGIPVETRSVLTGSLLPCGNGHVDVGEACDDANAVNGDGCDVNCTVSRCGNDEVGCGEHCDDGNAESGDGCSPGCVAERPCGPVDLRGTWDFLVTCDFGSAFDYEYRQQVELTQDCNAGLVTIEQLTGCDIPFQGWPTAGFACETMPVPFVGKIDRLDVRMPSEGTIHTTLTSPVAIPLTSSCSFTQVTVDAVLAGRIRQRYPGRASILAGTMDGTYTFGQPEEESCSALVPLPCTFSLRLIEAAEVGRRLDEQARKGAAELSILLAQQECIGDLEDGCAKIRTRVTPWIERARRRLERAASAVADNRRRGLRALKRAARALGVAERLTERRTSATRGATDCAKGLRLAITVIRQAVEALRGDLAELPSEPGQRPGTST